MKREIQESPMLFAALIGLYPGLFFLSHNWFMFTPFMGFLILASTTIATLLVLGVVYSALGFAARRLASGKAPLVTQGAFVSISILVLIYLLRMPMMELTGFSTLGFIVCALIAAAITGWMTKQIKLSRLNFIFLILCAMNLASGVISFATTNRDGIVQSLEPPPSDPAYEDVHFAKKPDVYYIIPDSYPGREALQRVFELNNDNFYRQLERAGFSIHHSVFANYISTLSSVSSTFGMGHHYYRGLIGNNELIGSRRFIVSEQNPTISIFKRNGYRIRYVHQSAYLLKKGCFVDECSPRAPLGDAMGIVLPYRFRSSFGLINDESDFEERVFESIAEAASDDRPDFTFIHMFSPGHSNSYHQKPADLAEFREGYSAKILEANSRLIRFVERIEQANPKALIVINGDHGGFGLGCYGTADSSVFDGLPVNLTILDNMAVLLAIRWPDGVPAFDKEIKTNANLFRFVFSYLSAGDALLETKVAADGYLVMKPGIVSKVIRSGQILDSVIDMGPLGAIPRN